MCRSSFDGWPRSNAIVADDLPRHDVVVVGAGPAGLAAAVACTRAGLSVRVLATDPAGVWPATYGCWVDEIEPLGLAGCLHRRWDDVRAVGERDHQLASAYGVFDNVALQGALLEPLGGMTIAGQMVSIGVDDRGFSVDTADHQRLLAAIVVDARGPAAICSIPFGSGPRQRAYGITARFDRSPIDPGTCVFMDWSAPFPSAVSSDDGADATFLYGFDLGDEVAFVEETSLARSPAMEFDELRDRLTARLERTGSRVIETIATEMVDIPMRAGVPGPGPALAFGSGGGQLHPATGYSVAASLRAASRLASAIAGGRAEGLVGERLAAMAWDALWPRRARRTRALHDYGLASLLRLTPAETGRFFDAFFAAPHDLWRSYLDITAGPRQVAELMRRVFAGSDRDVRRSLLGGDHRLLIRSISG